MWRVSVIKLVGWDAESRKNVRLICGSWSLSSSIMPCSYGSSGMCTVRARGVRAPVLGGLSAWFWGVAGHGTHYLCVAGYGIPDIGNVGMVAVLASAATILG